MWNFHFRNWQLHTVQTDIKLCVDFLKVRKYIFMEKSQLICTYFQVHMLTEFENQSQKDSMLNSIFQVKKSPSVLWQRCISGKTSACSHSGLTVSSHSHLQAKLLGCSQTLSGWEGGRQTWINRISGHTTQV